MTRSKSVEQMMEHVMERNYDFDLTYITERIISVFFLPDLEEQQYSRNLQEVASMLKSKHQDKFLVSGIVLIQLTEQMYDYCFCLVWFFCQLFCSLFSCCLKIDL